MLLARVSSDAVLVLTTLLLTGALDATVVALPLAVEGLALLDDVGGLVGDGAGGLGDAAGVAEAGHGGGEDREDREELGDVHLEKVYECGPVNGFLW